MLTLWNKISDPPHSLASPSRRVTFAYPCLDSRILPLYHLVLVSFASGEGGEEEEEKQTSAVNV